MDVVSGLLWQGVAMRSALKLLGKAARVHGSAEMAAIRQCTSRGAARKAEPRRGSWCSRGLCCMERLFAEL